MQKAWVKVSWSHEFADEPSVMLSELDANRFEVRKIEYFNDGRIGVASTERETELTHVGDEPVPLIDEINADPQFIAVEISEDEFVEAWAAATP